MSFFKDISRKMGITGSDDDIMEEDVAPKEPIRPAVRSAAMPTDYSSGTVKHDSTLSGLYSAGGTGVKDNVLSSKMNVIVIEPQTFDDAQQVANNLQKKKPVVINFENTETEIAKRIIDFISGTTYALNGEIKKIGHNVFLCAPSNVNVSYNEEERRVSAEMPWLKK